MKIVFNGRFTVAQYPTGTHRSAAGFLRSLLGRGINVNVRWPRSADDLRSFGDVEDCLGGWRSRSVVLNHIWEQMWISSDSELSIHPINTAPIAGGGCKVVFLHDLNILRFPSNYKTVYFLWNLLATVVASRGCFHVVCFSSYVRDNIGKVLAIRKSAISVVPQGPGVSVQDSELLRLDTVGTADEKFFLCVGSLQPHKNLNGILDAWRQSNLSASDYQLRIIGMPQANFKKNLVDCRGDNVVRVGYVSDEELSRLYSSATAFVYPSFEEGFGLPIVEAFHYGCPVITSNVSCLPEIAGGAAMLVSPRDPQTIANAMRQLAFNSNLRNELREAGLNRARQFTWERAGESLEQVLQEVERNFLGVVV